MIEFPERCARCKVFVRFTLGLDRCEECGIKRGREVMSWSSARRRKIGGKRGRNSGKVGTAKNK